MLGHEIVMKLGESPILEGFPHCNDITFSKICQSCQIKSKNEMCERFHGIAQPREEEGKPS